MRRAIPLLLPLALLLLTAPAAGAAELDREGVRRLQQELAAVGYDPGPADGLMGPLTSAAITAYQRDHGLPSTGEADPALLRFLSSDDAEAAPLTEAERRLRDAGRLPRIVDRVRGELRDHGFYEGPPRGAVTLGLRQAVRRYQQAAGLDPTGEIDQSLLDHLHFARPEVRL